MIPSQSNELVNYLFSIDENIFRLHFDWFPHPNYHLLLEIKVVLLQKLCIFFIVSQFLLQYLILLLVMDDLKTKVFIVWRQFFTHFCQSLKLVHQILPSLLFTWRSILLRMTRLQGCSAIVSTLQNFSQRFFQLRSQLNWLLQPRIPFFIGSHASIIILNYNCDVSWAIDGYQKEQRVFSFSSRELSSWKSS